MRNAHRQYDTPASIDAFCRAEADRRAYWRGTAPQMELAEPSAAEDTAVRPRRSAVAERSLGRGLPDVSADAFDDEDTEVRPSAWLLD